MPASTYETSVPFSGDATAARDAARGALLPLGFEVTSETDTSLTAVGPGMSSTNQPALCGVTGFDLRIGSSVTVRVDLGGVRRMQWFVYLFPPGLGIALALAFLLAGMGPAGWTPLWAVAPWLIIAPWMAGKLEQRTTRAVDALVRSLARI